MKKLYIAGPMRGYHHYNFPAFDEARDTINDLGFEAISPADLDREAGFDPADYCGPDTDYNKLDDLPEGFLDEAMKRDIDAIMEADGLVLLPGWEYSTGAKGELGLALWRHIEVYFYDHGNLTPFDKEPIAVEAHRIQGGNRQRDYGSPEKNFQDIADLWSTYLMTAHPLKDGVIHLDARDIAHMNILMKISRNIHKPKRDNWTDMAGYAQCGGKIDGYC
jgi:hypothetical protein